MPTNLGGDDDATRDPLVNSALDDVVCHFYRRDSLTNEQVRCKMSIPCHANAKEIRKKIAIHKVWYNL